MTDRMKFRVRRINSSAFGQGVLLALLASLGYALLQWQASPWPAITPLPQPRAWAGAALLAWAGLCAWIAWHQHAPQVASTTDLAMAERWLVIYASQTGFARELAERTAQALIDAGHAATLHDIGTLDFETMTGARCLFVASTTGEADPPDHALGFVQKVMAKPADLRSVQYAVLALGDREYTGFCAFGRQLDDWLRHHGARPLFDMVTVDNADASALRHWQHHIGVLAGRTDQPDWTRPQYQAWTLHKRTLLNPSSAGGPACHIALHAPAGITPLWHAGDIAEIGPRNPPAEIDALLAACGLAADASVELQGERMPLSQALSRSHLPTPDEARGMQAQALASRLQPLPHREYSIASVPADGSLDLLVRKMLRADGRPGLGSGWLCDHAQLGGGIDLRIRSNPNFHAPAPNRPMILIGNGTGLAGLRAHLKARKQIGATRNWLLFGERSAASDRFHGEELDDWLRDGTLAELDLVFSRDGNALRYVQDALFANAERLRRWIDDCAAIYVCGSLEGMAPGVDAALIELLGQDRVDALLSSGGYRRDVY